MQKSVLFGLLLIASLAEAKTFSNSYISFELPPNWSCKVAGTEWVCRSSNAEQARQAIIVLTAKEVGPNDTFAYYNQYLKTPKTPKNRDGTVATQSKVQHLNTIQIANHSWVDGLHLGSLLPNFYSRYLVTIKNKIAVLVTFSAKKEFYTQYSKHFFDAINSLRVNAQSQTDPGNIRKAGDEFIGAIGDQMDDGWNASDEALANANGASGGSGNNIWLYGIALILAGAGAFFMLKRNKKK
jgi:hypothetical protein